MTRRNLGHLFRIIPHISNFEVQTFCVECQESRKSILSLPEFPTSATVSVTILSNDQIMFNEKSVNDLGSFTSIIPASLSKERAWYLYEHVYGKSATRMRATWQARSRLVADTDNEIKRHCWCAWQWWPNVKKREK